MRAPHPELIAHPHHLAIAQVDFDKLGTAHQLAILILQRRDDLLRLRKGKAVSPEYLHKVNSICYPIWFLPFEY